MGEGMPLAEWRQKRKERQCLSASRCSTTRTQQSLAEWRQKHKEGSEVSRVLTCRKPRPQK